MPHKDPEARRRYHALYRAANPTKVKEWTKNGHAKYRQAHPDRVKQQQQLQNIRRAPYQRAWREANSDKMKEYDHRSYWKHREKRIARRIKWRMDNPEKEQQYASRSETKAIKAAAVRRYKAKINSYAECLNYPPRPLDGRCAICHREAPLCLDHDHETGHFRGYICRDCNMALGKLGDTAEAIRRVLAYLEKSNG